MKILLRRLISLFLLGVLMFTFISACSSSVSQNATNPQQPSTECRVVQHTRGETCIPLNPKRIVTLDFNSLAVVLALNIKPIATWIPTEIEGDIRYVQEKADGVEIFRSPVGQLNLEKLLSLKPDLIIVISHPVFEDVYKYVSQIAPTVILPWIETSANWKQYLKDVARVLERTEVATQLLDDYYRRVEELKQALSDRQQSIRISFVYVYTEKLYLARKKSFTGGILNDVGLLNLRFEDYPGGMSSAQTEILISEEILPEIDSDILFIAPAQKDDNSVIKRLQQKPLWSKLKAVQNNQVYVVDLPVWRGLNILAAHEILNDLYKYLINTRYSFTNPATFPSQNC
ncbi:iron-siderophore ABC transporter substrate-binding protein [Gloeocapsa sp. BRSZ]